MKKISDILNIADRKLTFTYGNDKLWENGCAIYPLRDTAEVTCSYNQTVKEYNIGATPKSRIQTVYKPAGAVSWTPANVVEGESQLESTEDVIDDQDVIMVEELPGGAAGGFICRASETQSCILERAGRTGAKR